MTVTTAPVADPVEAVKKLAEDRNHLARELEEASYHAMQAQEELEVLRSRVEVEVFEEAIQRAHERAGHRGFWHECRDPVCAALEEWHHFEIKRR